MDLLCFRYVDPVSPSPWGDLWRTCLDGMIDPTLRVDKAGGTGPKSKPRAHEWWLVNSWFWRNVWDLLPDPRGLRRRSFELACVHACLHACTAKVHFLTKYQIGKYRGEFGKDARLELEWNAAVLNFSGVTCLSGEGDITTTGLRERRLGMRSLSWGRRDGGGIPLYSVRNVPRAKGKERRLRLLAWYFQ